MRGLDFLPTHDVAGLLASSESSASMTMEMYCTGMQLKKSMKNPAQSRALEATQSINAAAHL